MCSDRVFHNFTLCSGCNERFLESRQDSLMTHVVMQHPSVVGQECDSVRLLLRATSNLVACRERDHFFQRPSTTTPLAKPSCTSARFHPYRPEFQRPSVGIIRPTSSSNHHDTLRNSLLKTRMNDQVKRNSTGRTYSHLQISSPVPNRNTISITSTSGQGYEHLEHEDESECGSYIFIDLADGEASVTLNKVPEHPLNIWRPTCHHTDGQLLVSPPPPPQDYIGWSVFTKQNVKFLDSDADIAQIIRKGS